MPTIKPLNLKIILLTIFVCLFFTLAEKAQAATYYVAPNGNNSHTKTQAQSGSTPWKTLVYAESQLLSGDTVIVRAGNYYERLIIDVANTTWQAYSGENPVIDGQDTLLAHDATVSAPSGALLEVRANNVTWNGIDITRSGDCGIWLGHANNTALYAYNFRLLNTAMMQSMRWGLIAQHANNLLIENSDIDANARVHQIYGYNGSLYKGSAGGLQIFMTDGVIIRNSYIRNNHRESGGIYQETKNALIENTYLYGNREMQTYVSGAENVTFRHNFIFGSNYRGVGFALAGEDFWAPVNADRRHRIYGNYIANLTAAFHIVGQPNSGVRQTRIFNNIMVYNHNAGANAYYPSFHGLAFAESWNARTDHIIRNNIVNQDATDQFFAHDGTPNSVFDHNWWNRMPEPAAVGTGDVIAPITTARANWALPSPPPNITAADFVVSQANWQNRGGWLTTVSSAVSNSVSLPVADAKWFHCDENITFSNGQTAKLANANYDTNVLTLTAAKTIPAGTSIQMSDFMGSTAPNIGPWTASGSSNPADTTAPAAPSGLVVR